MRALPAALFVLLCAGCRPPAPAAAAQPESTPIRFQEVAAASGVRFRWGETARRPLTALESFGHGCAFLDYDGDDWLDIVLVDEPRCGLFRSRPASQGRRFEDVTRPSGLHALTGPWKGCAVGDWSGDGRLDLLLTGYGRLALLRNTGRGFADVTSGTGIRHRGWASSAGFADYDRDGDLDLFVGNYLEFGPHSVQYCDFPNGARGGCPPQVYPAQRGVLYRNEGGGKFADVTRAVGMSESSGKTMAIGWCDYDNDGDQDLYLANDGVPANLYRNDGERFQDVGFFSGTALGVNLAAQAGMGVDWGDFNRDGWPDLVVSAFSDESYSLYQNAPGGLLRNVSVETGVAGPTLKPLGFGCRLLDLNNDGWADLVFANGHVYDQAARIDPASPFRQRMTFLENRGGRAFADVTSGVGETAQRAIVGRGLAAGDYDRDGRQDLLVVDLQGRPLLLRNSTSSSTRVLRLVLEDRVSRGNRFAFGARVTLTTTGGPRIADVTPVSSYLSSSDFGPTFALPPDEIPRSLSVRWSDGTVELFPVPETGSMARIRRGAGQMLEGPGR